MLLLTSFTFPSKYSLLTIIPPQNRAKSHFITAKGARLEITISPPTGGYVQNKGGLMTYRNGINYREKW